MKFRKKPVVIEAVQLRTDNWVEVMAFTKPLGNKRIVNVLDDSSAELVIETLEGNMRASKNDWIIKGVNGEFYPCKPDIFEKTYEPVEEQEAKGTRVFCPYCKAEHPDWSYLNTCPSCGKHFVFRGVVETNQGADCSHFKDNTCSTRDCGTCLLRIKPPEDKPLTGIATQMKLEGEEHARRIMGAPIGIVKVGLISSGGIHCNSFKADRLATEGVNLPQEVLDKAEIQENGINTGKIIDHGIYAHQIASGIGVIERDKIKDAEIIYDQARFIGPRMCD